MGQKMEPKSGAKVATGWPSVSSVRLHFSLPPLSFRLYLAQHSTPCTPPHSPPHTHTYRIFPFRCPPSPNLFLTH